MAKFEMLLSREKKVLKESIRSREAEFKKRYGMVLPEGRIDLIAHRMIEKGYDVNTVFEEVAEIQRQVEEFERDFERKHGIRLQFRRRPSIGSRRLPWRRTEKGRPLFTAFKGL